MTDKRKKRIKEVAAELGIGHRAAANVIAKRFACSRGGHVANRTPNGETCTDCGAALRQSAGQRGTDPSGSDDNG